MGHWNTTGGRLVDVSSGRNVLGNLDDRVKSPLGVNGRHLTLGQADELYDAIDLLRPAYVNVRGEPLSLRLAESLSYAKEHAAKEVGHLAARLRRGYGRIVDLLESPINLDLAYKAASVLPIVGSLLGHNQDDEQ